MFVKNVKKKVISLAALCLAGTCSTAFAGSLTDTTTLSTDIEVTGKTVIAGTITPQELMAGGIASNAEIANFTFTSTPASNIGLQFTDHQGSSPYMNEITGTNGGKMYVRLSGDFLNDSQEDGDIIYTTRATDNISGKIVAERPHSLLADTYTVNLTAGVYVP